MSTVNWVFTPLSWRVYDGDTLMDVVLDLGFNVHIRIKTRLLGINAPEVRGASRAEGLASRDYLRGVLDRAEQLRVQTAKKQGKYGRWLITLWDGNVNLNEQMVTAGHAVFQEY